MKNFSSLVSGAALVLDKIVTPAESNALPLLGVSAKQKEEVSNSNSPGRKKPKRSRKKKAISSSLQGLLRLHCHLNCDNGAH